jgi:hypothetical protein
MKKLLFKILLVTLGITAMTGCRSDLVYNVEEVTIVSNQGSALNIEDVKKAIIRAGAGLGWQMNADAPGHVLSTLYLRSHMAQVDINYTTTSYSITYKDSKDLNYDGTYIHSNYNGWVQNLQRNIDVQLNTL